MTGDKLQTANWGSGRISRGLAALDLWLWGQRESLFHWLPVGLGSGIIAWFMLPGTQAWSGFALCALALILAAVAAYGRFGMVAMVTGGAGLAALLGLALIWWQSHHVAAPVLARPVIASFDARVEAREMLVARGQLRLLLAPAPLASLPPRVRVSVRLDSPGALAVQPGDRVSLSARLVPPPRAALPGGYDFARTAWFKGIGAVGSALGPVRRHDPAPSRAGLRDRLSTHIRSRLSDGPGAIAAAFATGDQGAINAEDDEAMRRAGLSHLLSISGLHVTAAVSGAMWLLLRLLALVPRLALRVPLFPIAAAGGALVGFAYTMLTGAQVPTIRSLVAALLVLVALALGREAISMRLIAAGAIAVLLIAPEALVGPSFQLSFAAVTAIVALHSSGWMRRAFARRDEAVPMRWARALTSVLLTGLVVELALTPISLFHFHRAGLYGALANVIAIPLTTLVVMPAEALALVLDTVGLGAPAWWVVDRSLAFLLWLAHAIAAAPGAVATMPNMPTWAFALAMGGGLWMTLWRGRVCLWGAVPLLAGIGAGMMQAPPDLIITGDGRHVATRIADGRYALLRGRAGEFVRGQLAEAAGIDGDIDAISDQPGARCSPDFCIWQVRQGGAGSDAGRGDSGPRDRGRGLWVMAARSAYLTDWQPLVDACARVDIVIADRRLPRSCTPRWLKADRALLAGSGGLAITLNPPRVRTVASQNSGKPWEAPPLIAPPRVPYRAKPADVPSSIVSDSGAATRPADPE